MAGEGPGFLPKAALTTSRVVYKPFLIPQKLTDSSALVGAAAHSAVGGANKAIGEAYIALQPKGPAKWLIPLFVKTNEAVGSSAEKAQRNKDVFWDPVSQGSESIGRAIAGPGAYYYAKKAGFPEPSNPDVIKGLLNMKLFDYPVPPPPAEEGAPPPQGQQQGPPPEAAQQAAEGAGQAQPAA